jgi:hypothetical protein
MTTRITPTPAAEAAYEVVQEIRRVGERINNTMNDMRMELAETERALADDDPLRGGFVTTHRESPSLLLSNLRNLCQIALKLGVPPARVVDARRGEWVGLLDIIDPATGDVFAVAAEGWAEQPEGRC